MNKPTIIITGANGFIGSELAKHFLSMDWKVKAFVRKIPKNRIAGLTYVLYDLETPLQETNFDSVNFLVHAAYIRFENNKNAKELNLQGTKKLVEMCRKHQIKSLFISSFSAHQKAQSHYGIGKLKTETLFDLTSEIVLKPGFVLGKKGMASQIINTIQKSKFIPLIGGGVQPIQTIYIEDLNRVIENCFVKNLSGKFYVAEPIAISMQTFYREISKQLNKKTVFIPLPLSLIYYFCLFAEKIGMKLPIYSESVLGLKNLTSFETEKDLQKIGIELLTYNESITKVLNKKFK